jgi:DNA repair protein RadD
MQTLRPYQARDVDRISDAFRRHRRVCYVCPTGGGKTTVAAATAERAIARGRVVWMLVHRDELIDQAAARLRGQGLDVATLRAGEKPRASAQAHIVSIATAARRIATGQHAALPPKPGFMLVDEAHHVVAETWREAVAYGECPVLGLTATPERLDGTGLGDVFEALVVGPTPEELAAAGAIVPAAIWTGPAPDMDGVKTLGGDFSNEETAARARKLVGDVVETWMTRARDLSSICFAVNVGHSLAIRDSFRAAGVTCEHVDGATPKDQRKAIFDAFREGRVTVVTNVAVATEGFDLPDMRAVILARPTLSVGLYLQMVGRGLRPLPGKTEAIILDHGYNAARHGDPLAHRLWTLHASRRKRAAQASFVLRNGGEFFVVCDACLRANPRGAKICVGCGGAVRVVELPKADEGDLVAFDPVVAEAQRQQRLVASWHKFRAMARSRGWAPPQAVAIWKKSHGGKSPLDMGVFETPQQRQEYLAWSRSKTKPSQPKTHDLEAPLLMWKPSSPS